MNAEVRSQNEEVKELSRKRFGKGTASAVLMKWDRERGFSP
jgi:hypothetical protein